MKLLVVMDRFPWPPRTGSTLVAYNSILELAKRHSVSMLCRERPASEGDLADVLHDLHFPDNDAALAPPKLTKLLQLARGVPPFVSHAASRLMRIAVAERAHKFDALVLFELQAIQYCPASALPIVVANIEDPLSIKFDLYSRLPVYSPLWRFRFLLEARLLAQYERRVLPPVGRVLLLSEADVKAMSERGGHINLGHVPYGTISRNADAGANWNERAPGAIAFSGNMWHGPNVDGALFFLRDVFPLVIRQAPSAVLWIVGAKPDSRIVKAARKFSVRVTITGQVPDIAEYVSRARVSICPVRVKIGVQTKVLEALSVGTPVVSTSAGNSGIGGISGKHLWVEDDPMQFANRIVELLNGERWAQMSKYGREIVLTEFNWQRSVAALEEYLMKVARPPAALCNV